MRENLKNFRAARAKLDSNFNISVYAYLNVLRQFVSHSFIRMLCFLMLIQSAITWKLIRTVITFKARLFMG